MTSPVNQDALPWLSILEVAIRLFPLYQKLTLWMLSQLTHLYSKKGSVSSKGG